MNDFVLVSAAWMLNQIVTTYDAAGNSVPDNGEYQRRNAEVVYLFAAFMKDKGLLQPNVNVSRTPNMELRFSQLTLTGQQFAKAELGKWMQSLDRAGPAEKLDASGLERRWAKFADSQAR